MTLTSPTAIRVATTADDLTRTGLLVLLVAFLPVNFTFGSVNVLADAIGRDLQAGAAGQQLVLAVYTTAFAASLVIAGRLGDRFGRRLVLVVGASGVAILSIATAFAPDLATAIVLRVLLGVAAGLLTPQVLSTIQTTAVGELRVRGLTLFAAMSGVSTVLGQIVGGGVAALLPDHLGWRAVQILTGLLAACALLGLRAIPASRSSTPLAIDGTGAGLLAAGLLLVILPLALGRTTGWPAWTIGALAAGAAALAAFWIRQRRAEARGILPVVPPSVLRILVVRRGLIMTLLFFTTYGAFLYELSALAQGRFGVGPFGAAMLLLGFGLAFIVASLLLPLIVQALGGRTMTVAGIAQAILMLGVTALELTGTANALTLQSLLIPIGAAQAMMFGPVLQTVLSRAPEWAAGIASGLFSTAQQVGLSLGVALLGGMFWSVTGGTDPSGLDRGIGVAFVIHAGCAIAFAVLAASITRRTDT
ncbi:MFS transporter [Microbacterium karelineae]|uniref:MFS transporter n=1 Tax=Microbacterium karelineae TaxID=2654283 RepID=UPI0012EA8ED3|nr:MFS transporter [Microbacterium karelineae]